MGTTLLKIKLMPSSPDVDLEEIKAKAKEVLEKGQGKNCNFEEELIAFGLKAIIVSFDIDEFHDLELIERGLEKIENVNSARVIDMRRAFG